MFFPILIGAPILVGVVTGVWTPSRRAPWAFAALCGVLGVFGAIVSAFNADGRAANIAFALVAGAAGAVLVWAGYGLGRISRGAVRQA